MFKQDFCILPISSNRETLLNFAWKVKSVWTIMYVTGKTLLSEHCSIIFIVRADVLACVDTRREIRRAVYVFLLMSLRWLWVMTKNKRLECNRILSAARLGNTQSAAYRLICKWLCRITMSHCCHRRGAHRAMKFWPRYHTPYDRSEPVFLIYRKVYSQVTNMYIRVKRI